MYNYDTLRLQVEALVRQQGESPLDVSCEVLASAVKRSSSEQSDESGSGDAAAIPIAETPKPIDIQRELLLIAYCGCDSDPERTTIREEIQKLKP